MPVSEQKNISSTFSIFAILPQKSFAHTLGAIKALCIWVVYSELTPLAQMLEHYIIETIQYHEPLIDVKTQTQTYKVQMEIIDLNVISFCGEAQIGYDSGNSVERTVFTIYLALYKD